jgi:hypothetical protein
VEFVRTRKLEAEESRVDMNNFLKAIDWREMLVVGAKEDLIRLLVKTKYMEGASGGEEGTEDEESEEDEEGGEEGGIGGKNEECLELSCLMLWMLVVAINLPSKVFIKYY